MLVLLDDVAIFFVAVAAVYCNFEYGNAPGCCDCFCDFCVLLLAVLRVGLLLLWFLAVDDALASSIAINSAMAIPTACCCDLLLSLLLLLPLLL